jgi:DMSO/TMAO reductase YedYZ molybdopterin-dependent catalytic subunit
MKHKLYFILLLVLLLSACGPKTGSNDEASTVLVVTDGETVATYTVEYLQALGETQAAFNDVTYLGVPLTTLLQDAGFDPQSLRAVKVTALDGYTVNYDPALFLLPDTLVSYARLGGPLAEDELPFRMVLPAAEGKMNARMITEIKVIP